MSPNGVSEKEAELGRLEMSARELSQYTRRIYSRAVLVHLFKF